MNTVFTVRRDVKGVGSGAGMTHVAFRVGTAQESAKKKKLLSEDGRKRLEAQLSLPLHIGPC